MSPAARSEGTPVCAAGPRAAGAQGPRLLADIGGTNARFAWQTAAGADIADLRVLPCAEFATLAEAMQGYLRQIGRHAPRHCAIAIANPVVGDQIRMTNHHWSFSIAALRAQFGFEALQVLNDFTALSLALPSLRPDQLRQVGGGSPAPDSAMALIGPGTGLGVSGLLPDGRGGLVPLQGEGGHVTLDGSTPRERLVLDRLHARYGHVSAERALSGQGLSDLHAALLAIDLPAGDATPRTAAEVVHGALHRHDATCLETLDLFCGLLGSVAGNLALTLGARGGVYIGGGIVPRFGAAFEQSPFRARFDAKGRFRDYLAPIPVYLIVAEQSPALLGAAKALDRQAA